MKLSILPSSSNQDLICLDLDEFLHRLISRNDIDTNHVWKIMIPGFSQAVPLKFGNIPRGNLRGKPVVFYFHGALNREKHELPSFGFYGHSQSNAFEIAIADPLLNIYTNLSTTWYAGSEMFNIPELLHQLVTSILRTLRASRSVFVGGSTGGHPALLQSWYVPNSIAVVFNPVSSISSYTGSQSKIYRKTCWPSLENLGCKRNLVNSVWNLYAKRCNNNVIYLASADDHHFYPQVIPFFNAIRKGGTGKQVMLVSNYDPAYSGHKMSRRVISRWVAAACQAPTINVVAIAAKASELATAENKRSFIQNSSKTHEEKISAKQDIEIANRLLDSLN
jgi:hypothetical protein